MNNGFLKGAKNDFDLGLSVFPIPAGIKEATLGWKKYQSELASWKERTKWFSSYGAPHNVGVICGGISGGLFIEDFESLGDYKLFHPNSEELQGKTRVVLTPHGGVHVYGRSDQIVRRSIRMCDDHPFDLLGDGGYAVGAPSILEHSKCKSKARCQGEGSGEYEIMGAPQIWQVADDPYEKIILRMKHLGWKLKPRRNSTDLAEKLQGVEEGNRNNTAFGVARQLLFKAEFDKQTSWEMLLLWNERCKPPLDTRELKATFESAQHYAFGDRKNHGGHMDDGVVTL